MTTPMTVPSRLDRLEEAMRRAWHNLDMAEQHDQPANVLDRFEARYFEALGAYEAAMRAIATKMR